MCFVQVKEEGKREEAEDILWRRILRSNGLGKLFKVIEQMSVEQRLASVLSLKLLEYDISAPQSAA